ncbi:MAG: hypothetical protein RTV31_17375, partial [Candidatus Thorarchaeota archaeon]
MNSNDSLLSNIKRSKIDYIIVILAFVLLASNQVFEKTPLGASGHIEITDGAAIPQESNYTISTEIAPSVTSAILLNYTRVDSKALYFDVSLDSLSRIVFDVTLQSTENNTDVSIFLRLGHYDTTLDVNVGILPRTFTIEPDMGIVLVGDEFWIRTCQV